MQRLSSIATRHQTSCSMMQPSVSSRGCCGRANWTRGAALVGLQVGVAGSPARIEQLASRCLVLGVFELP